MLPPARRPGQTEGSHAVKGLTITALAIVGGVAMAVVVLALVVRSAIEPIAIESGEDD